jgi:hypothetical protein
MAEAKTQKTKASVKDFIDAIPDEPKRKDAKVVDRIMRESAADKPAMWGPNIVGYGSSTVTYANGKTADWPVVAFSPRKAALVLYLAPEVYEARQDLLARLGKHTTGKSCLYVKKLADVDTDVLRELVAASVAHTRGAG